MFVAIITIFVKILEFELFFFMFFEAAYHYLILHAEDCTTRTFSSRRFSPVYILCVE